MVTMPYSEMFFLISSIGFIIVFILLAILLLYLIKGTRSFARLVEKIEENIDTVGEAGKDLIDDLKHSLAFKLLFKGRKK
jgi:uncharacterized protein YoxC